ncbi:hypothetical protein EYZ11_003366 [Aspergillus tanneri]|uniref:Vacuolar sorting protein VPS33/slp1 n=1 Tax=Aspergillus tanneri TaxID=1220188 RepID=A0A4S3JTL0_9EURO|nr:hypothetical protein EYZ11_003366 [Aspergillus tanneri]
MSTSILHVQRDIILNTIRFAAGEEWKVLVVDETSRKLISNSVSEDDILNNNVTILDPQQRSRIERSQMAQEQIASFRVINTDYFPRESRVVTFRDPWSFPVLFHPGCNHLIRTHLEALAQKVVSLCVSLGEYPVIRYYRPKAPTHEAGVLCSHLARFIQNELDQYAHFQRDFPPPSPRPRGVLLVVDRSIDLIAPLIHEFTYQSMVHDLLPINDGDKVTYKTVVNEGGPNEEVKDMEISDQDNIWVDYRHLHMKDVLEKLGEDFAKFRAANPQFADENKANVDTIKDMLAGLTEFQQGRDAYTLHLNMAQECMKYFQEHKLLEVSSVEQCLATGVDENYKKAKGLASQLVQLMDDEAVGYSDRLRLLLLYIIYRGGLVPGDIRKLLAHGQLPPQDNEIIYNLDLLGVRAEKPLKDDKPPVQPLFNRKPPSPADAGEMSLSRYELNVKVMLEELVRGTLDPSVFPFTRPQTDADGMGAHDSLSQASLRSAKPTWARTRSATEQPKQRIIVFMAGGATYGESRACYEISQAFNKDTFLATSHMLSPSLFLRQVGDLSADRRRLDIPAERPKPTAPAHLFEKEAPPQPVPKKTPPPMSNLNSPAPPSAAMGAMSLGPKVPKPANGAPSGTIPASSSKPQKEKEKKKRHFFR